MKVVLIMGLPGSGKTTLAKELVPLLNAKWLNADKVRTEYNDWDFSAEGRVRQANRMRDLAKKLRDDGNYVVADFVCPTKEARKLELSDGFSEEELELLVKNEILTVENLADLATDELTEIFEIDEERAAKLIMSAREEWLED